MSTIDNHPNNSQEKGCNANAASAEFIGLPFHNPYNFIPFPEKVVDRHVPYPLTIDEVQQDRKTGILELEVVTISPLLCCSPIPVNSANADGHKVFKALTIGNDVVMPASSIRGALRTLITIITGSSIGHFDENQYLCQGRDLPLGPRKTNKSLPKNLFLAEVTEAGSTLQSGKIKLGETSLVELKKLEALDKEIDSKRPKAGNRIVHYWIDNPANPTAIVEKKNDKFKWKLKLSGCKVNRGETARTNDSTKKHVVYEGAFNAGLLEIELPEIFWAKYMSRNRHGAKKTLNKGDLIWLEPNDYECDEIKDKKDIKSIQWARWGREGVAFRNILENEHINIFPDAYRDDECITIATELFGQIPKAKKAAGPFAARIRPHNLIFFDGKDNLIEKVALAPLSNPHPGCIAFYRDVKDLDLIDQKTSSLKGYKVYRNTRERGNDAPWNFAVQGVFDSQGKLKQSNDQSMNKTVDLLSEGCKGRLRIAYRALDEEELATLITTCTLDWKLGGGKPLGLGHCRVRSIKMIDEDGEFVQEYLFKAEDETRPNTIKLPDNINKIIKDRGYTERIELYKASQIPVDKLRYPRAVETNRNTNRRAGIQWFTRHAAPKKSQNKKIETVTGLQTIWTQGELRKKTKYNTQIKAQALNSIDPKNTGADLLFGYDGLATDVKKVYKPERNLVGDIVAFDPAEYKHEKGVSGENTSQNRETRKNDRGNRN